MRSRRSNTYSKIQSGNDNISLGPLSAGRTTRQHGYAVVEEETSPPRQYGHTRQTPDTYSSRGSISSLPMTVSSRPRKVAIKRSFVVLSIRETALHAVSLSFSVVIIALCAAKVYFRDVDAPNINAQLSAFQFVATIHNTIVGMSLGAIAVHHLLYELCRKEGLPLGYLVSPFQLSAVTIPFRTRFWKASFSKTNTLRKYLFGVALVGAVVLQALIGPSAAVLIVPQLEFWEYPHPFGSTDGFTYFNKTNNDAWSASLHEYMWPSSLNSSIVPSDCNTTRILMPEHCPYNNMASIRKWGEDYRDQSSPANITSVTRANQLRYVMASGNFISTPGYCAASTAMAHVSRNFGAIWEYAGKHRQIPFNKFKRPRLSLLPSKYSTPIMRPLVQVQCAPALDITDQADEQVEVVFPSDFITQSFAEDERQTLQYKPVSLNASYFRSREVVANFTELQTESGNKSIGVVFGLKLENRASALGDTANAKSGQGLFACTIASHWIPTNLTSDPLTDNIIHVDVPFPRVLVNDSKIMSRARPVTLEMSYLDRVNIIVSNDNFSTLEYNLKGLAVQDIDSLRFPSNARWMQDWPWILAAVTSMQLSDALARVHLSTDMMVVCQGCAKNNTEGDNLLQRLSALNDNDSRNVVVRTAKNFKANITAQPNQYVPVEWHVQRYGYGWGLNSLVKWLSMGPIITHALVVFAHIVIITKRRTRFEVWDSFPEFLSLANRSPTLDILRDLGIGVADSSVFDTDIVIRALPSKADESLSAVLTDDKNLDVIEDDCEYD